MVPGSWSHSLNHTLIHSKCIAREGGGQGGRGGVGGRSLLSSITLLMIIQTRSLVGFLQPEPPMAPLPCSDKVHPRCCVPA